MSSEERITVHNLADLKNTSDDAIPNYLNSLKFTQSHTLVDIRLALGYTAFAIAGACFAWDYKFGFDATKQYSAIAVALYTLINSALTLWIWLVEKGVIYQGTSPSGEKISVATSTVKNVPTYHLKITLTPKSGASTTIDLAKPFTQWFDSKGTFVVVPFQEMLATGIPAIGKLDARRVRSGAEAEKQQDVYDPAVLDAVFAAQSSASATGSTAESKSTKRRKA
ncbi:conserved hypothetical protein [Verticillium alfalfae VaMs.102]|uniref:Signal peptidase complex subunit 2 n=1 Tax=Verticillium alfalfae (strain VaMs.102 / ATCC MYA-4576 / FGSC 10136) TaxID=526221 RepID=C9SMJ6_VERA1|nr:conserved hypothetical protein [Verticillium alfalfae VaMs.102]EEY20011.1 conserved hypothetical protein [Verticillium alfalfae VaMs.102]